MSNPLSFYDDTLGLDWSGILGQVGAAGAQTGLALLFGPRSQGQGGGLSYPLRDSGQMARVLDGMWAEWLQAKRSIGDGPQLLEIAETLLAWLNNAQVFVQSGSENDAYLNNSKTGMRGEVDRLRSLLAQTATPTAQTGNAQGNATRPSGSQLLGYTVDTRILLIGGAALVGVLLLVRE